MTEARAWSDELRPRADALDEHARAEVLFTWAVTAVEVGDDAVALDAIDAIEQLNRPVDDPHLESELQLAVAWTLPIRDDFDGALAAAAAAVDGFRQRNDPFVAFAELSVGMLEASLEHPDRARPPLERVDDLGAQYGNSWLEASARTQLASLAVSAGDLETARSLLGRAVEAIEAAHLSSLTLTFALVTAAQLARADGDSERAATGLGAAHGLRSRAGLTAWPLSRRRERQLIALVEAGCDSATYEAAFAAGTELSARDALALVRSAAM